jgi:hypothetical protein
MKEIGVFAAWLVAIFALVFTIWFFTQTARARFLQENVNSVLIDMGRRPYLGEPATGMRRGFPLGTWYNVQGSGRRAVVFTAMSGGVGFPCVAIVSDTGVDEIILLNARELPAEILFMYKRRIEKDLGVR